MSVIDLLARPVYGMSQVDRLLLLSPGTSRRWIEGYSRGSKTYPPVVRDVPTGEELVTWGEFVETRLLAEFRYFGATIYTMRGAVEKLREAFRTEYPLAHSRSLLDVVGRELVLKVQSEVGLDKRLLLVVVRNNQVVLTDHADNFVKSVEFSKTGKDRVIERIHPRPDMKQVVMDPLKRSGEPVVRAVPTEIIAEQMRAGDSIDMIAKLYELDTSDVEAAIRYELQRQAVSSNAA